MREYYNPKLRISMKRNEKDLGEIEQGNLTFLKNGQEANAYIDISDSTRVPILPVWEELD